MKSIKTTRTLSMTFSLLSIISIIYVDIQIAIRYVQADGKTKALFGLVEVLQFNYKYLILIPATLSILLTVKIIRSKEFKIWDIVSIFIALSAIIATMTSHGDYLLKCIKK